MPPPKICNLTFNEYLLDIALDSVKTELSQSKERTAFIQGILGTKSDIYVLPTYMPYETNNTSEKHNKAFIRSILTVFNRHPDKIHIGSLTDLIDPDSKGTHYVGYILNPLKKEVLYYDTGGEGYGVDAVKDGLALLSEKLNYTLVHELFDGSSSCQIIHSDTFCMLWSLYYSLQRLNNSINIKNELNTVASAHRMATKIRTEKLFDVLQFIIQHLSDTNWSSIYKDMKTVVANDKDGELVYSRLDSSVALKQALLAFFQDKSDANKRAFHKVILLPLESDCKRKLVE